MIEDTRDLEFLNTYIQVYIFSDRVEIVNPGGLPPGMSYADLGKKSMPRNFSLFGLMQRMALVEKVGTGILRMNQAMDKYKLEKPIIEADGNWFNIIFKRRSERWSEKGLTERVMGINTKIKKNPRASRQYLSAILGINPSAVQKHMAKLKDKGLVERVGPAKGGYWEVTEDEDGP